MNARVVALVLVLASAVCVQPTRADDATATAKAHFAAARAHYDLGRFEEALGEFEMAYQAKPLPKLLFNIGQCHFQQKRYARAVFFYERYLELHPDLEDRSVIEELIEEARRLDVEAERTKVPAAPEPAPAAEPLPAPPAVAGTVAPPPATSPDDDSTWMVLTAGVGAAVVVTAGVVAWAMWTAPPPPGSLGIVDRRAE